MSRFLQQVVVWLALASLLLAGFSIYQDYGYSWDEETSRLGNGLANYQYFTTGDRSLLRISSEKYHGPAFEIVLFLLEKGLGLNDSRSIYLMRHLVTFLLFFAAVVVFYRLLRQRFHSRLLGLVGASFLILSPRIFADAFYNSKDLAFLSAYIFALATLGRFLRIPSRPNAILHALACGFLIDIRILGMVIPLLTVSLLAARWMIQRQRGEPGETPWRVLSWFMGLTTFFVILFWPNLWRNPPGNFIKAFNEMRYYPWPGSVLYLGKEIPATQLPWHYLPWWMLITTPVLYSLFFLLGCGRFLREVSRKPLDFLLQRPLDIAWVTAFFLPLLAVIGLHSTVYDGWRHLYFVYPAFLFIAVFGLAGLLPILRRVSLRFPATQPCFACLCCLALLPSACFMVRQHPYQNVYFNFLAGPDMQTIKSRYEMDYWGLSCRAGLEKLLALDPKPVLTICAETSAIEESILLLPPEHRRRLRVTSRVDEADYYLSHYRNHRAEFPAERDVCAVCIGNAKLFLAQKAR